MVKSFVAWHVHILTYKTRGLMLELRLNGISNILHFLQLLEEKKLTPGSIARVSIAHVGAVREQLKDRHAILFFDEVHSIEVTEYITEGLRQSMPRLLQLKGLYIPLSPSKGRYMLQDCLLSVTSEHVVLGAIQTTRFLEFDSMSGTYQEPFYDLYEKAKVQELSTNGQFQSAHI